LKPKAPTTPYSLAQIKTNMLTGSEFEAAPRSERKKEKILPKAPGYLIVITGENNDYVVRVRDPYGKRLTTSEARHLVTLLRKNLI
jgi:outer membrane protein assembly factor BamC